MKNPEEISVIPEVITVSSIKDNTSDVESEEARKKDNKLALNVLFEALGISAFGIIGFCLFFIVPWTSVTRTDSIIYQSHWWEALLPFATHHLVFAGTQFLELTTWTKEKELMSIWNFLKIYLLYLIPFTILYILSYVIWSVQLQYNHPLPYLWFMILPVFMIWSIGLWLILPSKLLAKDDFRRKLKIYIFYYVWMQIPIFVREIFASFYGDPPGGFQFLVPFMVAGLRELDLRVRSKFVTKMMGEKDEAATAVVAVGTGVDYSTFIAIRVVGAEFATICCTVAIDFVLHLRKTLKIIKEYNKISDAWTQTLNKAIDTKITLLVLAELIEGFTPIIYAISMMMAFYGPNANILSNIGNSYWGKQIDDLWPIYVSMSILFGFDTLSVLINCLCIWKAMNINMMSKICQVLSKYWYVIAIILPLPLTAYIATLDVNFGVDDTQTFQWISNEGWINLVNASTVLNNEEKTELIVKATFQ